jgi:hypothetical protein
METAAASANQRGLQTRDQRHDLRLLSHVELGDGPSDDHALYFGRASKIVKLVDVQAVPP